MIVDELIAILGYDLQGEGELQRFNAGLEKAATLARSLSAALVAAGTVAAGAMAAFGASVISTSATFEGFETSLTTIEGSAEKARASMDWIADFAAKTPYDLEGVTDAFIKLKAYGIDPVDGTLLMLGDTASAMNKPLNQAVEAFADATNFQFERLREFGLTASQKGNEVTFQWTKNGKALTQVVKKNGAEIQKFLKDHFGSTFSGAMIRQSKTWNGMMSTLSDSWQIFQKRVGDAGFFNAVKSRLGDLLDYIGRLDSDGTLDRWASRISDSLTSAFDFAARFAERIVRNVWTIGEAIDNVGQKIADFLRTVSGGKIDLDSWQSIIAVLGTLLAVLNPTWVAAAGLALAIDDFLTYMRGGDSVIGRFVKSLDEMMPSLRQAFTDAGEVIKNMDWRALGSTAGTAIVDGIREAFTGLSGMLSSALGETDWRQVGSGIGSSIDFASIGAGWIGALKAQFGLIVGLRDGLVQGLMKVDWGGVARSWISALDAQIQFVLGFVQGAGKKLGEAFGKIDWGSIGSAWLAGIRAPLDLLLAAIEALAPSVVDTIKGWFDVNWSEIGTRIGNGILQGLQSVGGQIKEWFAGLIPDWARDFFATGPDLPDNRGVANDNQPATTGGLERQTATARQHIAIEDARAASAAGYGRTTETLPGKAKDDFNVGQLISALNNFRSNSYRTDPVASAAAAMETVNNNTDNRDQSVSVSVGGVVVQGVQNVNAAVGGAVGTAVGNSAARGAQSGRPARIDMSGAL